MRYAIYSMVVVWCAFASMQIAPAVAQSKAPLPFDGTWRLSWESRSGCIPSGRWSTVVRIRSGVIAGRVNAGTLSGTVSVSGVANWTVPAAYDGATVHFSGTFRGNTGSGTFSRVDKGHCSGIFKARRH
jgi:hypothetical protein